MTADKSPSPRTTTGSPANRSQPTRDQSEAPTQPFIPKTEDTHATSQLADRIDQACDAFEREWQAGKRPAIFEAIRGWSGPARAQLFQHLLELELDYLSRAGEQRTAEIYVALFPEFRSQIEHCFGSSKEHSRFGSPPPPQRLGEYDLQEKIGEGGMGAVYKARHRRMNRVVALKILSPRVVGTPLAVERFQREVQTLSQLSHPNIVTAFDAGEDQGVHYLVMEFVPGRDLSALVKEKGRLPVGEALRYILQAAEGLEYAHRQGIVHRDIKPGNLLVDEQGRVRILDLGLARGGQPGDVNLAKELTQPMQMLGTVDYMSPEQAANSRTVDQRTDIYSLGCTLYRLLTNRCLYDGDTVVERIVAHREQPIPSLRDERPEVPLAIEAIYRRMVAKKPADRPNSLAEVIPVFQAAVLNVGAGKSPVARRAKPIALNSRHYAAIGGGVIAVVLLFVGIWFAFNRGSEKEQAGEASKLNASAKVNPAKSKVSQPKKQPPRLAEYPLTETEAMERQVAWGEYLNTPVTINAGDGGELVLIPPGKFTPGSTAEQLKVALELATKEELDSHYVDYIRAEADMRLKQIANAFYLGKTEVTVAQFRQFVEEKQYQTTAETNGIGGYHLQLRTQQPEANWKNPGMTQADDHPVVEITIPDAEAYLAWLTAKDGAKYFLPTETQWEYACRAGTTTPWICGDSPERLGDYAWYDDNSERTTHPVASKLANAFGLHDMHGSVREWTSSPGVTAETHIIRGGEFLKPPVLLRSSMRIAFKAATPYPYHGFRVAREIKQ